MELVSTGGNFRQIFITDTNREHLDGTIASLQGRAECLRSQTEISILSVRMRRNEVQSVGDVLRLTIRGVQHDGKTR